MKRTTFFSYVFTCLFTLVLAGPFFGGKVHAQTAMDLIESQRLSGEKKKALKREVLDSLFGRLHNVKTPKRAEFIAGAIWKIWANSSDTSANLLLKQAERAMAKDQTGVALAILSTLTEQYPDFAEGWNRRATVLFIAGDYEGSIADINKVLDREPRHFGALAGLGLIYQAQGKKRQALSAFRRALAIHPHLKAAKRAVKRLKGKVEQDI